MIKTLIVDDEHNAREFLEKMLHRYFPNKFYVCQLCESVDQACVAIEAFQPDLVFLDIQMPNKNGFELFKEIKEISFEVVFTTAHSEFAIEAIKRSALDYLLKPINYLDLLETVTRYEKKTKKESQQEKLKILLENIDTGEVAHKKIAIATEVGFEFVKFNSMIYLEAQSNYTRINLSNGNSIIASKTLKSFEELLPEELFYRTDKNDSLKEFLVSQSEPEDEDPSKLHSIFRYFGKNLITQTQIRSEGYNGGNLTFLEDKFEVTHKNNPETIGTYNLSKFFIKQTKLFVGRESEMVSACPFVYLKAGDDYVFKGEIIRNLIGKAAESEQTLELGTADSEKKTVARQFYY